MELSWDQLSRYRRDGFLFLPEVFPAPQMELLRVELYALSEEDSPRRILEKDGTTVRTVFAPHTASHVYETLTRDPRLVVPAQQIVDGDVYIHQFKINVKAATSGDLWEWHQDYLFWLKEDGMPSDRVVTASLFLDEVTPENGPLTFVPGSHQGGVLDVAPRAVDQGLPAWSNTLTADLKYALADDVVETMIEEHGTATPIGPAGSVLFFHGNVFHGSAENSSADRRALAFITYNSVENCLEDVPGPRPDYIANRNFEAIVPLAHEGLRELVGAAR